MGCGLAGSTVHLAWLVHHVLEGVWGADRALWSFRRFLPPIASHNPWFILLMDYCPLPIVLLSIQLLIFPLVETSVAVVVEVVVGGGVVEVVVVVLHLVPLAL